jgi:hypothetical protein
MAGLLNTFRQIQRLYATIGALLVPLLALLGTLAFFLWIGVKQPSAAA